KSAQIREILISESAWEEMTCLFAPSFGNLARPSRRAFLFLAHYARSDSRQQANSHYDSQAAIG
ncbi:hypothetical protein ELE64_28000, partial [Klebsiella pneumoniae]|nr:hypothetical protein [Klebsiella pneumoniae]MBL1540477.1 hypothetical protein [Klebsiella pneumoniae]MBL1608970.1 hypothetical protein [Klebsiella pneumoniae]MBL1626689.1 hypothetical protein [Klebsiella pneumoniae]MBL1691401.1 hypothetical protein [Klebsiella pneumoniae]